MDDSLSISEQFSIEKLLRTTEKKISILCKLKTGEKKAILEIDTNVSLTYEILCDYFDQLKFQRKSQNDIYYFGELYLSNTSNESYHYMLMFPVTDIDINWCSPGWVERTETAEDYRNTTKPYIEKNAPSVQWIYNIIDGNAENEIVVCRHRHFVLIRDRLWDRKDVKQLSYTALFCRRDLKSIRDLKTEHAPLIEQIAQESKKRIARECKLNENDIFAMFHYFPSYWHLHIHFKYKKNIVPDKFSVDNVLRKLRDSPHFYQTAKLNIKCKIPQLASLLPESTKQEKEFARKQYRNQAAQIGQQFEKNSFSNPSTS